MELLTISTLLLLISTSYGDNITSLSTGLVDNPFGQSVLIAMPATCEFSGKTATLKIKGPGTQALLFTVPQCRLKRDLVVVNDTQNGNVETISVGYEVQGLVQNTNYSAWYEIDGTIFNTANFTTKNVLAEPPAVFRRSGGMVVITVILSIAMFLLLVGLIVVLVLGGRGKK
ncbi:uroplakin-2 [Rhinoderma darwinii]|uniref:uroplakin-2 n=1 Tax=Rhinoderma darwinii TaxID=43563 RepID=UPI003F661417